MDETSGASLLSLDDLAEMFGFKTKGRLAVSDELASSPAAPLGPLSSQAGEDLAADIGDLLPALFADGENPSAGTDIATLAAETAKALVGAVGASAPATGGLNAAAYAPTSRFLTQATDRFAGPNAPDPADIAARLLATQPQATNPGMLADGSQGLLSDAIKDLLSQSLS